MTAPCLFRDAGHVATTIDIAISIKSLEAVFLELACPLLFARLIT